MIILFLHRDFPAQFRYLATELAKDAQNTVLFITSNTTIQIPGVKKFIYKVQREASKNCHKYLKSFEDCVLHGQAAADVALALKKEGLVPDVIYGHSWGLPMFMKEIFPNVPLLGYFEWFGRTENSVFDFNGKILTQSEKEEIKCNNSHVLLDLYNCDGGVSPTVWQKNHFPTEFHNKIKLLHDGVDTDICKPDENAKFYIKDGDLTLTAKDEVITYATRGMEPYRGFPEFMEAAAKILRKRPNAHVIIAGEDIVCYSPKPTSGTYKQFMLQKLNMDMNRVHFVGTLAFEEYIKLLQISSAHIYLTYPFILSWSILDAMACECCIIGSKTAPVEEVLKDNYNGLLVDFPDVYQLTKRIEYALELKIHNKNEMKEIRQNARKTVVENYALKDLLPQHIEYIKSFIHK